MKKDHIIIAGGTGFLGQHLAEYFENLGKHVTILTRGKTRQENRINYIHWNGRSLDHWMERLEGAEALINLSGKSVNCRYTKKNKKRIYDSRLQSTRALGLAMMKSKQPPKVWINATSATIYRHAEDRPMTEENGVHGHGFSVDVCEKWERMFFSFDLPKVRLVAARTAIVLGTNGGALPPLKRLVQMGLGGRQGDGNQRFSWIHTYDFCRAMHFLIKEKNMEGPVNLSAPEQVINRQLMKKLRDAVGAPLALPTPTWMLKLGALIIGTETELVLKSRWVSPEKLERAGFEWEFPKLEKALADLCTRPMFKHKPVHRLPRISHV